MAKRSLLPEAIDRYVNETITRQTPLQLQLRQETAALPNASMQIGADQGAFLALMAKLIGARFALEIGAFTGYSSLAVAAALPEDGELVACDMNEAWTKIARRYWKDAGLDGRIRLRMGPARETLQALLDERGANSFDIAFIDADKMGYDFYYESCLTLVRPGGLIALDNMLWSGAVAESSTQDEETEALKRLNLKIADDARVDCCLLTLGDGVMLARRK
jgi:O-methyltransferase